MYKLLFFPLLFTTSFAISQVKISGKITDNKKNPLAGISVSIISSYDGATTDSAGNYSFVTTEKGEQTLTETGSGYRAYEDKIKIASAPINLNIELKELITELKAVVISAGTFEVSDSKRATALNPIDIVTTASAYGDITSAIKTLPGTQQVGESEGLFVRGGTADDTKIFIDGTLVNKFFIAVSPDRQQEEDSILFFLSEPFLVQVVIPLYIGRPFLQFSCWNQSICQKNLS